MKLYFQEKEHKYVNDKGYDFISTTTLIGKYYEHFNTDAVANACEKIGRNPAHPKYLKYKGKKAWQIKQEWATATKEGHDRGNYHHNTLEDNVNFSKLFKIEHKIHPTYGKELFTIDDVLLNPQLGEINIDKLKSNKELDEYPKIKKLLIDLVEEGFSLYAELGLFDEENLISGLCDLIAIKNDSYIILDWKTNKIPIIKIAGYFEKDMQGNLTDTFIEKPDSKMFTPINHLPDCNYTHYCLQLNMYDRMVALRGLKSLGRILIHITHDTHDETEQDETLRGKYIVKFHNMLDYKAEVEDMIKHYNREKFLNDTQYKLF